jgi:type III secretion apparatus needle protein
MALFNPNSNFTLASITNQLGGALAQQEQQLNMQLTELQNSPNPSQQDLVVFQANLQLWTNLLQLESSIIKIYGDTMKQVVNNAGS